MASAWGQDKLERDKQEELMRLIQANIRAAGYRPVGAVPPAAAQAAPVPAQTPIEEGLNRIAAEIRLLEILDEVALKALISFDAVHLIIDRTGPDAANITAVLADGAKADLWELDPLMWDEANEAAVRYYPQGEVTFVSPRIPKRD